MAYRQIKQFVERFDGQKEIQSSIMAELPLSRRKFLLGSVITAGTVLVASCSPGEVNAPMALAASPIKIPSLKELKLFDSCVTLGKFTGGNCIGSVDQLLSIMDRYYIEEALVHDYHARTVYPIEHGNQRLMRAIINNPRLHPVWVLEPPVFPGRKSADKIVNELLDSGVRAVRLRLNTKGLFSWVWMIYLPCSNTTVFLVSWILEHKRPHKVHYTIMM